MNKREKLAALAKTEKLRKKVGANFKEWRLGKALVLTKISRTIKVSQGSLSDIQNGKSFPAFETVRSLKKKYPDTQWDKILFA